MTRSLLLVGLALAFVACGAGGDSGAAGEGVPSTIPSPSVAPAVGLDAESPATPAPTPTPTVTPIPRVGIAVQGEDVGPALVEEALDLLEEAGYVPLQGDVEGQAVDLYLGYEPPEDFHVWPLTPTQFVPVVSFWLPITDVTSAELEAILAGDLADWAEVGSPRSVEVVPLALQTRPNPPLQPLSATLLPNVDALVAELEEQPGGIAMVPLQVVDPRLRALSVDGRDLILEEEFSADDPLVRSLVLAVAPEAPSELLRWAADFALDHPVAAVEPAIEIAVVGDVVPGRGVRLLVERHGGDYRRPFLRVAPALRRADLTIVNLEGVLSYDIPAPANPQTFYFVASGDFCDGLLHAGVDGVSLANNHSMNFGRSGLEDTIALLEEAEISYFGAGMNLEQARRPALFEVEGVTFAFLGFDGITHELYGAGEDWAGTAPAYSDLVMADVAAARDVADVVIPYFHWGMEYTRLPTPWQERLAHEAVEAGADLILGNHPHWVQGLERYRDIPILYSLGNFVFDQMWSLETRQGVIARLIFRGTRLVGIRFQAVLIEDHHQPHLLSAQEADEIYRAMESASARWPQP